MELHPDHDPNELMERYVEQARPDPPLEADSTLRYVSQIREWISACDKLHPDTCVPKPIPEWPPEDVPLWLIDTHRQCIVPGLSAHRYLALSYVWPESRCSPESASPVPRTLLLNKVNVQVLQKPGFLSDVEIAHQIPNIIKHAMKLTRAVGERYLWVDRLCIVQHDLGDEGTLSQVAKMDKIYAGAYFTIIAAAPEEMYEDDLAFEAIVSENFNDNVEEVMSKRYQILSSSRWATRGWTYQEQVLCKRAIFFTEKGLFWDCQCAMWDGVKLRPGQNFAGIALRTDMGQRFSTRWWPDFALYIDLFCPYNGREFSYPQDALLGIAGVLNALENSFPGGFVCGLPRLFFDHALLWQPFGTADRRIDRVEDDSSHSSLPSWSWCGWQGFVDPWSLRSGLSYIYDEMAQNRARSWYTRNLVQWSLSVGDQRSEPLLEPCILDQYVDASLITANKQFELPEGWKSMKILSPGDSTEEFNTESSFFHERDKTTLFKHPVPLKTLKEESSAQSLAKIPACLMCSTTTASLIPAAVLKRETTSYSYWLAISKISAFEDKIFKRGPLNEKASPVLVLQQENGAFGGLIRLMTDSHVDQDTPLQLVAISTGSANAQDLRQSFEWNIFETGKDDYSYDSTDRTIHYTAEWISEKGKNALLFDFAMAFDQAAAGNGTPKWDLDVALTNIDQQTEERIMKALPKVSGEEATGNTSAKWDPEAQYSFLWDNRGDLLTEKLARDPTLADNKSFRDKEWFEVRTKSHYENHSTTPRYFEVSWNPLNRTARGVSFDDSLAHQQSYNQKEIICEFYNVLWVENRDGISYRRACGWVPKHIWESIATEPVDIKLG